MTNHHYAVFGHPVSHSLSPRIHAAFGRQTGIELDYTAIDATPEGFAQALEAFAAGGGKGANVTMPLKEAAFALCATTSERARRAGSVNTLIRMRSWRAFSSASPPALASSSPNRAAEAVSAPR